MEAHILPCRNIKSYDVATLTHLKTKIEEKPLPCPGMNCLHVATSCVATLEPSPTRSARPNRNPGMLRLFLFIFRVINFLFLKCRDSNPRPDQNGGSESEPCLLRRFHLSYQNILLCHFVAEAVSVLGKPIIIYKFNAIR